MGDRRSAAGTSVRRWTVRRSAGLQPAWNLRSSEMGDGRSEFGDGTQGINKSSQRNAKSRTGEARSFACLYALLLVKAFSVCSAPLW